MDEKHDLLWSEGQKGSDDNYSVRAMCLHRDKVTGVDRLFLTIGSLGIFSGYYDDSAPGKIIWSLQSESGPVETRPLAIIEANGDLLFSAGRKIYRRNDGPKPAYQIVEDMSDLFPTIPRNATGGIRGLTAIPNPNGKGDSLNSPCGPEDRLMATSTVSTLRRTGPSPGHARPA